jgi:hypothetical protein
MKIVCLAEKWFLSRQESYGIVVIGVVVVVVVYNSQWTTEYNVSYVFIYCPFEFDKRHAIIDFLIKLFMETRMTRYAGGSERTWPGRVRRRNRGQGAAHGHKKGIIIKLKRVNLGPNSSFDKDKGYIYAGPC